MASVLPANVGIEDFAIYSEDAETAPPHSNAEAFSSPPAPPLSSALSPDLGDYNYSANIYDDYAGSRSVSGHGDEYITEEDDTHLQAPNDGRSTRTSISSFPGSILPDSQHNILLTPTKSPNLHTHPDVLHHGRSGSLSYKIRSPASRLRDVDRAAVLEREHGSGFRNPSSVRAMQMGDEELFDSDVDNTTQHRRSGSRMSIFSHRSTNSSPTKRTSRSSHSTPRKVVSPSKLKKEFPLILLHCSLLPPTLALKNHISDEALLEEVLPAEYWRRWKVLQDKVGENNEVRTRGVLIPHPRDDYDLLEERLLESLELERPRIRKGHYIGGDVDSGIGTESEEDAGNESEVEGQAVKSNPKPPKCSDCGKRVPQEVEVDRKWEVRVYAANGLMRAGAWVAAWPDMEKVDIEVSVWMPETVRREIDGRLKELEVVGDETLHQDHDEAFDTSEQEHQQREMYEHGSSTHVNIDGFVEDQRETNLPDRMAKDPSLPEMDLQTLTFHYLRDMMQDRRNIFMVLMSVLVLFLAISNPQTTKESVVAQPTISAVPEPPITMISVSTLTSIEVVTATVTSITTSNMSPEAISSSVSTTTDMAEESEATFIAQLNKSIPIMAAEDAIATESDEGKSESSSPSPSAYEEAIAAAQQEQDILPDHVVEIFANEDEMFP